MGEIVVSIPDDRSNRRAFVMLHLPLRAANLILELPFNVSRGASLGKTNRTLRNSRETIDPPGCDLASDAGGPQVR